MRELIHPTVDGTPTARDELAAADAARAEGRWDAALEAYGRAARLGADDPAGGAVRADALRGSAIVRMAGSDWLAADEDLRESLEEARRIGDEERRGKAENALAAVAFERGDWRSARQRFAAARRHAEATEDVALLAQVEQNEGALHAARGDRERAEACFRRALETFEALGSHPCAARVWNNLGLALMAGERLDEARDAFDRAMEECRRQGDELLAVKVVINSGRLALRRGRPNEAQRRALKAWAYASGLGEGPVAAGTLCLMGETALAQGDWIGATRWFRQALERARDRKAPLIEAEIWVQVGHLSALLGNRERAVNSWRYARHLYRLLGAEPEVERILDLIESRTTAWREESAGEERSREPVVEDAAA